MTLFFATRTKARTFAGNVRKVVDNGASAANGRRWGVQLSRTDVTAALAK